MHYFLRAVNVAGQRFFQLGALSITGENALC